MAAYQQLLQQASSVASTPYQAYNGQLVAPVNSQQTTGINNINASAGSAAPYVNQAAGLASSASNPLTASQIASYQSPYTQQVVNATQAQFNDQNGQQQAALTGNQIAQGALGGNRSGIAASNLAGQQQLSQAPVIAGLENQGYTNALQTAAQQYQQNPLAAANSIANFGISGQNAALQGANAQVGAGTLQQQTQQQQDTAGYNQFQLQQAYPFQQTQWLAGIDSAIAPGFGTTTTGSTTAPAPNQTAQYLGAGLLGASLLNRGGVVHKADAGGIGTGSGGFPYGVSSTPYGNVQGYIPTMQVSPVHLSSSPFPQAPNTGQNATSGMNLGQLSSLFKNNSNSGGFTIPGNNAAADSLNDAIQDFGDDFARGGFVRGYADGGDPTTMDERFAPVIDAIQSGVFDPQGANSTDFQGSAGMDAANRGAVPLPVARNTTDAPVADDDDDATASTPAAATPTAGISQPAPNGTANAGLAQPAPSAASSDSTSSWWTPNLRAGILSAGLGMLASRSPFLGVAVGEGGLQGVKAYSEAEGADAKTKQDAIKQKMDERRLEFEAQRIQQTAQQQAEVHRHNVVGEQKEWKPTWGVIGETTDPYAGTTHKTYGWIDPNKQVIKDAQGKPVDLSTSPTPPDNPSIDKDGKPVTGQDFLTSVNPDRAARAKLVGDYQESPTDMPTRGGVRAQAVADAKRYNPDYNEQNYGASQKAYGAFTSGPESRTIRSLNVATDHLETLRQAALALKNGDYPLVNSLVNRYREATGSPLTTDFDSIKQAVSSEIAKVIVGGQTALQDRDEMSNRAKNSDSQPQLLGIFDQFTKLMGGQMKGLRQQYESGTYRKDFDHFLLPSTKKAVDAVSSDVQPTWEKPTASAVPTGAVGRRTDTSGREWYVDGAGKPLAPVAP